jgi:hypothetical protein
MPRPSEDDREAVDRAFADLVAGYHLTSDRPDPLAPEQAVEASPAPAETELTEGVLTEGVWADEPPPFSPQLFNFVPPPEDKADRLREERFVPPPPAPLARPAWPVLLAWIGMGYAVLAVLAATLGAKLPPWAGWLALVGFVGGFGILVTRLPRNRPPDAGDGAVL